MCLIPPPPPLSPSLSWLAWLTVSNSVGPTGEENKSNSACLLGKYLPSKTGLPEGFHSINSRWSISGYSRAAFIYSLLQQWKGLVLVAEDTVLTKEAISQVFSFAHIFHFPNECVNCASHHLRDRMAYWKQKVWTSFTFLFCVCNVSDPLFFYTDICGKDLLGNLFLKGFSGSLGGHFIPEMNNTSPSFHF